MRRIKPWGVLLCLILALSLAAPAAASDATAALGNFLKSSGQTLDLNSVGMDKLKLLDGVSPDLAKSILDYRSANGAFKSVKELLKVPGMTEAIFQKIAPFLSVK